MRVAVLGATGNVGTEVVRTLSADGDVDEVVGIARRRPAHDLGNTRWVEADVTRDDLAVHLRGTDVVVHLAWLIQPSRDEFRLWEVNVRGTERILRAVHEAGVGALVYASSVGAYSPAEHPGRVDESWPTHGVPTSTYSRAKAYVERLLDTFERDRDVRVVRLRKALVFQREAASEIRRLFLGSLFPNRLLRSGALPVVPDVRGARFQVVHARDAAEAYRLAVRSDERGAFNIAAEPVLDLRALADVLGSRPVRVPRVLVRPAAALTWRLRLHPVEPGWVDLGLNAPVMSTERARTRLGWQPRLTADHALAELVHGIRDSAGDATPQLRPDTDVNRAVELTTGQGARE